LGVNTKEREKKKNRNTKSKESERKLSVVNLRLLGLKVAGVEGKLKDLRTKKKKSFGMRGLGLTGWG